MVDRFTNSKKILIPFAADLLAKAFPFFLFFVLARILPSKDIALLGLFDTARSLLLIPILFNLSNYNAGAYFRENQVNFQTHFIQSLVYSFLVTLLCLIVTLVLGEKVSAWLGLPMSIIIIAGVITFFEAVQRNRVIYLQVSEKLRSFSFYVLLYPLFTCLVALIDLFYGEGTWLVRPRSFLFVGLPFCLWHLWKIRSEMKVSFFPELSHLKTLFLFGVFLLPHNFLNWLFKSADKLFLLNHLDLSELGTYSLIAQFSLITFLAGSSLNYALKPLFFQYLKEEKTSSYKKIFKLCITFTVLVLTGALLNALVAQVIIERFLSAEYVVGIPLLYYLSSAMACMTVVAFMFNYFYYSVQTYWVGILSVLFSLIHIALMRYFIDHSPMYGAGKAMLTSSLIMVFITFTVLTLGYRLKKL